ncbi:MAG: anthranilate synthase component I [Alphaproteobacteria bacterium]|nr:anthranilate synthase component I [Alphaproteobacteria bacterium]
MSNSPDFKTFEKNFADGKSQLVWMWVPADLETTVSAFLKLSKDKPYSLMLESVEGGAVLGRYSAIGLDPDLIWTYQDGKVEISENGEKREETLVPVESLRAQIKASKIDIVDESIPPMGPSGLFGYMGYDCVRLIEDIPNDNPDVLDVPESVMMRPTLMVLFDNVKNMMCLITPMRAHASNCDKSAEHHFEKAQSVLAGALNLLSEPIDQTVLHYHSAVETPLNPQSNMSREQFHGMVDKAKEYILAGDIFQVVPSQRFSVDFDLPAFDLYRSLRRLNPSPFLFYINFDGFSLVGSSPEILVRLRDNKMTIRPIAGTRKRGADAAEDKALKEDLLADPKEIAEHLMLLDLGRNDIGRVSKNSSVDVTDQFTIEYYSHVMHIVSNVEGQLKDGMDSLDALFAGFPAGTVSGAPKIRAMEIIDELEPDRRGTYAGCVGYFDGNGDLDTCIALRTALVKDNKVYVQAGGGVVADSDPEFEYQESCNKAKAVLQAAEDAINVSKAQNALTGE